VKTWNDGRKYEGLWANGCQHGKGRFSEANGNVYEGEFFAGKAEGEGVLKTAKGDVYAGQWQQGREWGEGVCQWADRRKYTGDWQGGKKHGQGCMMWPDGTGELHVLLSRVLSSCLCHPQIMTVLGSGAGGKAGASSSGVMVQNTKGNGAKASLVALCNMCGIDACGQAKLTAWAFTHWLEVKARTKESGEMEKLTVWGNLRVPLVKRCGKISHHQMISPRITFDFSQVEGIWDNGTLKPSVSAGIGAAEAASAVEADDLYDDSFDDDAGGSGNGSDEDRLSEGEVISERDADRQNAAQESEYQAPPASALPLYDVTSSQFVVHVQQQSSNVGAMGKIQGPVRPVKVKKTTVPSFIGLKLRLKVVKMLAVFLRFLF
jgi:hypothetical protein